MQSRAVERDAAILDRMQVQEQTHTTRLPLLNGGIRTDKAPIDLAPNEVVAQEALHVVRGRLVVDTGYARFSGTYDGIAQKQFQAVFDSAVVTDLLITTFSIYRYVNSLGQWQLVSWNMLHETTATAAAGDTLIAVDDATDIVIGVTVGVSLDDATQHITTVANVVGLDVTLADAIPAGRSVAVGANVAVAVPLAGDPQISQVCITIFPGNEWVIFCNGIDEIMYFDPSTGVVQVLPGLPTTTACRALKVFHECLLIGNLTEGGADKPWRVRMSDQADPTGWDVGVDGIAAVYDLLDTTDPIRVLETLGPWLFAYRDSSVMRASYIGNFNETLFWEYMVTDDGAVSQGAVAVVGARHIFVGHTGIWAYSGDYNLVPAGEAVYAEFLAAEGDLYAPLIGMLHTCHVEPLRQVWVFYPSKSATPQPAAPNKMLRLSVINGAWATRRFSDDIVATGRHLPQNGTTWQTAPQTWEAAIWEIAWNSNSLVQNVPNLMLLPYDGEQLFVYDYTTTDDDGNPILWELVTAQFGDETAYTRWERVELLARGEVAVYVSEDEGVTWTFLASRNFGTAGATVEHFDIDRTSTRMQFKFSGGDPEFELRRFSIASVLDSEW